MDTPLRDSEEGVCSEDCHVPLAENRKQMHQQLLKGTYKVQGLDHEYLSYFFNELPVID